MGTTDTLTVLQTVFGQVWYMLCHIFVPGLTGVSFGAWLLAGLIISFMLALIRDSFGVGGTGQRAGQSRTKHISKERRNDEK